VDDVTDNGPLRFPEGFLWGAATSAHQVEGGNTNNDWWAFEQAGKIRCGEVSGDACDHYRRFASDFDIARDLGHNAHRLSVEWSRVEPQPGVYDEAELAHYEAVIDALLERGIAPCVTLHHFTSPVWLAARGGWESDEAVPRFVQFAARVVDLLGSKVHTWITLNEPMNYTYLGYVIGYWPPQRRSWLAAYRVAHHLVRAHCAVYTLIHDTVPGSRVGIAANVSVFRPHTPFSPIERVLVRPVTWLVNEWFFDNIRERQDFIGLQYYTAVTVRQLLAGDHWHAEDACDRTSDLGWEIRPEGIAEVAMHAWRRYGKPILITENGIADASDRLRTSFIRDHLVQLYRAISQGADVRGYFYWSLLDNFEWREGFFPRFGLVEVDYETQDRRVRDSARWMEQVCRTNQVEPEPAEPAG
jgi:beta-glucosidase